MSAVRPRTLMRMLRFGITGVVVTVVHVVVASLLIVIDAGSALANGAAFCAATVVSYVVNTRWSFGSRPSTRRLTRFVAVSLVGCAVAVGLSSEVEAALMPAWVSVAVVAAVLPPLTFLMHNFWTYAASDRPERE